MSENATDYDVVVVGLGPCGLLAAALFGKAGLKVLGLEMTDGSHVLPRATAMDDENVRTLAKVGIEKDFISKSLPAGPMQILTEYFNNTSEPDFLFGTQHPTEGVGSKGNYPDVIMPNSHKLHEDCHNGYRPGSYLFYQPEFERMLRELIKELPNVETRYSVDASNIEQTSTYAEIHVGPSSGKWKQMSGGEWIYEVDEVKRKESANEKIRAKYVLGCDGSRSYVRTYINPVRDYISLDYDKEWIAIDVMLKNEEDIMGKKISDWSHTLCNDVTQCLVIPCSYCYDQPEKGRHLRFDFEVPSNANLTSEELQSKEYIQGLISTWLDPTDFELIRATVYRFHCLVAPKWRDRRVFIAGDACHTMPPFLGQGLNQGVKDIANLWWKIVAAIKGNAHDSLLDSYQRERYARAMKVVASSMAVGQLMETIKENYRIGGNEKVRQYAVNMKKNGFKLVNLFRLGQSKLDIDKPIYDIKSPWDGTMFPQLLLRKPNDTNLIRFDDLFNKADSYFPLAVILPGILSKISTCMSSDRAAYLKSLDIPILKVAKYSELKSLKAFGRSIDSGDYYMPNRETKIVEKSDLVIVRRDGVIYGAASGIENVDRLVDELKYSGYYTSASLL